MYLVATTMNISITSWYWSLEKGNSHQQEERFPGRLGFRWLCQDEHALEYLEKKKVKSLSCVQLFVTPWTLACQGPPSMGFSRQEYRSGLPFPSPSSQVGRKNFQKLCDSWGCHHSGVCIGSLMFYIFLNFNFYKVNIDKASLVTQW